LVMDGLKRHGQTKFAHASLRVRWSCAEGSFRADKNVCPNKTSFPMPPKGQG
jgi:hypothetical protein